MHFEVGYGSSTHYRLGCGTDRNTFKLLGIPGVIIVGIDASEKMIEIAHSRCGEYLFILPDNSNAASLGLMVYDPLEHSELFIVAKKRGRYYQHACHRAHTIERLLSNLQQHRQNGRAALDQQPAS